MGTDLLLSVGVLVYSCQSVLHSGEAGRQAQQQTDYPLQVAHKKQVALKLHRGAALLYYCLQAPPPGSILFLFYLKWSLLLL